MVNGEVKPDKFSYNAVTGALEWKLEEAFKMLYKYKNVASSLITQLKMLIPFACIRFYYYLGTSQVIPKAKNGGSFNESGLPEKHMPPGI
ncbi:hypothetical protein Leryth_027497 [Lithospermum erythrorhizon]|nr:hypothetical protein Leryth_027497 [Lithospermum erythrorhizon]